MKQINAIILAIMLCLVMAGCGGSTYAIYTDGYSYVHKEWREGSWDPFAPSYKHVSSAEALATARGITAGRYSVTALDSGNAVDPGVLAALELEVKDGALAISTSRPLDFTGLYIEYDATSEHVVSVEAGGTGSLAVSGVLEPGLVSVGVAAVEGSLPAGTELALIRFASGPETAPRRPSFSQSSTNEVGDLTAVDNGDESATLSWSERNTGDYDLNSEVSVADLVPIAQFFGQPVSESDSNYAQKEVVDGDSNGEINSADLVPIAQNLGSRITGYNVYRTQLDTPDEVPDPADSGRWTKIENTIDPTGPSILRDMPAGQDFRLTYTLQDETGPGGFGWYVEPTGTGGGSDQPGVPSIPATLTVEADAPPGAALTMQVMEPNTTFLNVDDEFYVAISVENITGLFSANVRVEYDSTLLEFVEGVGEYDTNTNLLGNYLFLAADDVGDAGSPYTLLGFNITQRQGTPPVDGTGVVGYLRFRAIGSGVSESAIRFPLATTYILLWGEQYGVPIATPALGEDLTLNIS